MEFTFHNSYVILELVPRTVLSVQSSAADAKAIQTRLRWSYFEVIATNIIRLTSQSG